MMSIFFIDNYESLKSNVVTVKLCERKDSIHIVIHMRHISIEIGNWKSELIRVAVSFK